MNKYNKLQEAYDNRSPPEPVVLAEHDYPDDDDFVYYAFADWLGHLSESGEQHDQLKTVLHTALHTDGHPMRWIVLEAVEAALAERADP
jgi:hypothetical protein